MQITPGVTNSVWEMTKFLLESVYVSLAPDAYELEEEERERLRTQKLQMTELEEKSIADRLHSRRTSILDIDDHTHPPLVENLLSRSASRDNFSVKSFNMDSDYPADTFENVLNVAKEHEAVYSYYYLDNDKVSSIFKTNS